MCVFTIVTVSDFGRALPGNGGGTDHGWGGNHMIMGGGVRGGRVLGQFPAKLDESSDDRVSGYIVPTTPWESIWKPIAEWLGVEAGQMDVVLPNANKFSNLLGQADVYN